MQRSYLYRNNSIYFVLKMTTKTIRLRRLLISILPHFSFPLPLISIYQSKKNVENESLPLLLCFFLPLSLSPSLLPPSLSLSLSPFSIWFSPLHLSYNVSSSPSLSHSLTLSLSPSYSLPFPSLIMFLSLFISFSSLVFVTSIPLKVCCCRQPASARRKPHTRAPVAHRRGRTAPRSVASTTSSFPPKPLNI